jgi:hypothetical protein
MMLQRYQRARCARWPLERVSVDDPDQRGGLRRFDHASAITDLPHSRL